MTLQEALKLPLLTKYVCNWRQRRVEVRQHPTDKEKVISIGFRIGDGKAIVCEEKRSDFWQELKELPPHLR